MDRIEKTVFLSYRRTNFPWALAIFQSLTQHGYDVFFDYDGIASGDFEQVILGNITARAHFLVVLTPSALERCHEPGDWLRREIETALASRRNIVPLLLEHFNFGSPGIANQLTGTLSALKNYNGVEVPQAYFNAAMELLRSRYLNVPLTAVLHPASLIAQGAAIEQKAAANAAPPVTKTELTAQQWVERGFAATDTDEQLRCYSEAVRIKPDLAVAFNGRGAARYIKGDIEGALRDFDEAIRLRPDSGSAFNNRSYARYDKGDLDGALRDANEAIRIKPDNARAFNNRGRASYGNGDFDEALKDYNEAIRIKPDYADAFYNRGRALDDRGDLDGAIRDYDEAIRLRPDYANAFFNRARARRMSALNSGEKSMYKASIADYQKYLDLGGGLRDGDQSKVEQTIRELKQKL
jgi:tetratricopeptide (TPR) repeat protein